jgi:hypothetical protein
MSAADTIGAWRNAAKALREEALRNRRYAAAYRLSADHLDEQCAQLQAQLESAS